MKRIISYSIFLLVSVSLLFPQNKVELSDSLTCTSQEEITEVRASYREKFQEVFIDVLESAANDFEDVCYDSAKVQINHSFYQKVKLDFPQAEYAFYQKSTDPNRPDEFNHSIKIYYNAKRKEDDIFLDNDIYNELYTDLVNEFEAIHKVELGGKWKMKLDDKGFKMLWDKDPQFKIYIKPSGTTGLEVVFNLTKE